MLSTGLPDTTVVRTPIFKGDLDLRWTESGAVDRKHFLLDLERLEGEYSFRNSTFRNIGTGRGRGLRRGNRPFSKHEKGVHLAAVAKEGVPGKRLIRHQQTRESFEGRNGSEEAPHHLAYEFNRLVVGKIEFG